MLSGNVYSQVEKGSKQRGTDVLDRGDCAVDFAALLKGLESVDTVQLLEPRLLTLLRYMSSQSDVRSALPIGHANCPVVYTFTMRGISTSPSSIITEFTEL